MARSKGRGGPWFYLQGSALLGGLVGAIVGAVFPLPVALVVSGVALVVFIVFFRRTLWTFISRKGLYQNFFGIQRTDALSYLLEGLAGGVTLGGLAGEFLPGYLVVLFIFVGVVVLALRYHEIFGLLASQVGARFGTGGPRSGRYRQLLRKAGGDEALVERLIAYERRRAPGASREEWIERAITRWERDRG